MELLKEILSIPTYFGREELIREFIIDFGIQNGIPVVTDHYGNVYLIKNKSYFTRDVIIKSPCVVAHMDTVHINHIPLINNNNRLVVTQDGDILTAKHPITNKQTGIGGDDKCGIYICLELVKKFDNIIAAFFVEEEYGCKGSSNADENILKYINLSVQFDSPEGDIISKTLMGEKLYSNKFIKNVKPLLTEHNYTKFVSHPYTDTLLIRKKTGVNCLNLSAGYYNMHTDYEYVKMSDVNNAISLGEKILKDW